MRRLECLVSTVLTTAVGFIAATLSQFPTFQFVNEPSSVTVLKGQSLTLACSARCDCGPVSIEWLKDGAVLPPASHRQFLLNGSLYFETIIHTPSHKPDKGSYQCRARATGLGAMVSRVAQLNIAYMEKDFSAEPIDLNLFLGDVAMFACQIDADPPPTIKWKKDGLTLPLNSGGMIVHKDGTLEIESVHFSDLGRYACMTENVEKTKDSREVRLSQNSAFELYEGVLPYFVARPRDVSVIEGSSVELVCAANGRGSDGKSPEITWLKDGLTINLSDQMTRFSLIGQGSLRIDLTLTSDAGLYTCRASNREDSVDAEAELTVYPYPSLVQKPKSIKGQVHSDAEFECSIEGVDPKDIQWLKNGEKFISSNYYQISDAGRKLKILGLMESDAGIYQCLAENKAGSVQAAAILQVSDLEDRVVPNAVDVPAAPTHLMVAYRSTRFVTLAWRPPVSPSPIVNYTVYWKEEGQDRSRMLNTTSLEANIQGLEPSTRYTFRVKAVSARGAGPESLLNIETDREDTVPTPPTRLVVSAISPTQLVASWAPPDNINGVLREYRVIYYADGEITERSLAVLGQSVDITGLRPYGDYYVRVTAVNENGLGTSSEEVNMRTFSTEPSAPPQNVSIDTISYNSIMVNWEPPPKDQQNGIITGYKLWYRKAGDKRKDTITEDSSKRSCQIADLERDTTYEVRLAAINVNGTGVYTDWLSTRTAAYDLEETSVPGQPGGISTRPMDTSIVVQWLAPNERNIRIRGYELGYGKGFPDQFRKLLAPEVHYHTIEDLEPGQEYVISVRAYNSQGFGQQKLESVTTRLESTPEPLTPMIPPVGLKSIVISNTSIVLTWTDSSIGLKQQARDGRYYTVRFTQKGIKKSKFVNVTDLNVKLDGLRPNTEYDMTVKVVKGDRESGWALQVSNTTAESVPADAPRDLTPVGVKGHPGWVTLNWQPPRIPNGLITGYYILYTTNNQLRDDSWGIEHVPGSKLTATIKDLSPDTTYYFKVQARNGPGIGPVSTTVIFMTQKADGTGGGRVEVPSDHGQLPHGYVPGGGYDNVDLDQILSDDDDSQDGTPDPDSSVSSSSSMLKPPLVYVIIGCAALLLVVVLVVIVVCIIQKHKKNRHDGGGYKPAATTAKPPDLWITHEHPPVDPLTQEMEEMKPLNSHHQLHPLARSFTDERYQIPAHMGPIKIPITESRERMSDTMSSAGRSQYSDESAPMMHGMSTRPGLYANAPRVNAAHLNQGNPSSASPSSSTAAVYKRPNPPVNNTTPTKIPGGHIHRPDLLPMHTPPIEVDSNADNMLSSELKTLDHLMKDLDNIRQQDFEC